ncbi:Permease [Giardia duodenalis]|uniref:Permease n=1 Tax=Giardia intestinalis TaxID=5741 RepID=V6TX50_GIAIN|nr:Permease [Giardia intestinalis]
MQIGLKLQLQSRRMAARRRFRAVMLIAFLLICAVIRADCAEALTNAGCKTCTGSGNTQTCLTCKDSAHFIQLDKKGCTSSCTGDGVIGDSAVTPKVCKCDSTNGYTLQSDGTCKKQSDNTNRSSLSTGAIAGISVAAVVVVGGLVGFLCWWFICRGKA